MRSLPGARRFPPRRPRGGGAQYGSPRSGPLVASSSAALSRTERVTACSTASPAPTSPYSGPSGFRARVGLKPNTPQQRPGSGSSRPGRWRAPSAPCPKQPPPPSLRSSRWWPRRGPTDCGGPTGRFTRRHQAELGGIGLAQHDESGPPIPPHQLAGPARNVVAEESRALCKTHARISTARSLSRNGTPAKAAHLHVDALREGLLVHRRHHGVQEWIEALDRSIADSTSSCAVSSRRRTRSAWASASSPPSALASRALSVTGYSLTRLTLRTRGFGGHRRNVGGPRPPTLPRTRQPD